MAIRISKLVLIFSVLAAVSLGFSQSAKAQGTCEEAQSQCAAEFTAFWDCMYPGYCAERYQACEEGMQHCTTQHLASQTCVYNVCNQGGSSGSSGGTTSFSPAPHVPFSRNGISSLADTPTHKEAPYIAPVDLKSGRGPSYDGTEGDTSDRTGEYMNSPWRKGGPTDFRPPVDQVFTDAILHNTIKPCFNASQELQDYYNDEIVPRMQGFQTYKANMGNNMWTDFPSISDCDPFRCAAGFGDYC